MVKKPTRHKHYRAKKRRQRTRRRGGGFKCFGFGCSGKPSVAPLAPPPAAAAAAAPVVVANPMLRFPDPAYLVVGGKKDILPYKDVYDTRTFYSNPAYYILDNGEPISEERSRYIRADFNDKTEMERIANTYRAGFNIIIFDWATAHNFYNFIEIVPLFRQMLKMDGKLVLDPSFYVSTRKAGIATMNITTRSINELANDPTYLLMQQVINEVYIKNKMYRASGSTDFVTFDGNSLCYLAGKDPKKELTL